MQGAEHHAMVPGIILQTYKNLGRGISEDKILAGTERGKPPKARAAKHPFPVLGAGSSQTGGRS